MMEALLAQLKLYKNAILAVLFAALLVGSFVAGWKVEGWRWDSAKAEQLQVDAKQAKAYDDLSRKYAEAFIRAQQAQQVIYKTITKEIPNVTDNRVCFADAGALSVWNAALTGVPNAPAGAADAPSGAGVSDRIVLTNAVDNFQQYKACRDQLNKLIDWYEETK